MTDAEGKARPGRPRRACWGARAGSPERQDPKQREVTVQSAFQKPRSEDTVTSPEVASGSRRTRTKPRRLHENASLLLGARNPHHDAALRARITQPRPFRHLPATGHLLSDSGVWWGGVGMSGAR